jgi:hypothetical protein
MQPCRGRDGVEWILVSVILELLLIAGLVAIDRCLDGP